MTRGRIWCAAMAAMAVAVAVEAAQLKELKNGTEFAAGKVPSEIAVQRLKGKPLVFSLPEGASADGRWKAEWNAAECDVTVERRAGDGLARFTILSRIYTPARVEFRRGSSGRAAALKTIVYTVGEAKSPLYPRSDVNRLLAAECAKRGLQITDYHIHIRGGMTPELALVREKDFIVRSSAMENHGREWEIYDNAKLREFAARSRAVNPTMPVGIQVNDRDWFRQIDAETRAKFDYILADTMIMGKLPSGRDNRLWMVKEIADPEAWMEEYFAHTMRVLGEPVSILANPTYLPLPVAGMYDKLWTEERMRAVIAKAVERGVAIEIQAESPYPSAKFLRMAKEMGAKFSFGTNNFDPGPKNLSRWLECITWLDLKPEDLWTHK